MDKESIKKALECCANWNGQSSCKDCPIGIEKCYEDENLMPILALTLINELESENELLRNAKVVYETVDYCYEDLKKAEKRIAELETKNEVLCVELSRYTENCIEMKNGTLKQFAERLKEHPTMKIYSLHNACERIPKAIDETLKEFIK